MRDNGLMLTSLITDHLLEIGVAALVVGGVWVLLDSGGKGD